MLIGSPIGEVVGRPVGRNVNRAPEPARPSAPARRHDQAARPASVPAPTPAAAPIRREPAREQMALKLGLDKAATWEQINAELDRRNAEAATANVQLEQQRVRAEEEAAARSSAEVEATITRLKSERKLTAGSAESAVREAFAKGGRGAFDTVVVELDARPSAAEAAEVSRAAALAGLQSSRRPADSVAIAAAAGGVAFDEDIDAWEANRDNPELHKLMRSPAIAAAVGVQRLTHEHIKAHGARKFHIVSNLRELIDETARRGDA